MLGLGVFFIIEKLVLWRHAHSHEHEDPSEREVSAWDRFTVAFRDGGRLVVRDPRLLGGVELDPDESLLGPDALSVTPAELRRALGHSEVALKARLMDQHRLAGVGNLLR